jgi:hypothetical protein
MQLRELQFYKEDKLLQTFGFYNGTAPLVQSERNSFSFILTGGFPPATLIQYKEEHDFTGSIQFDSPITQGNLLIAVYMRQAGSGASTFTDSLGNTWTLFEQKESMGLLSRIFGYYCYNCIGGIDVLTNSVLGGQSFFIAEYSGIQSTSDPLITANGNVGGDFSLTNTLSYLDDAMIFSAWFNATTNSKTGIYENELTYINNDVSEVSKFNSQMHSLKNIKYLSPITIGINTNGSPINVLIQGVFKLGL